AGTAATLPSRANLGPTPRHRPRAGTRGIDIALSGNRGGSADCWSADPGIVNGRHSRSITEMFLAWSLNSMLHPLIKPYLLELLAYVYLRQSSPGQVRKNREGWLRQNAMVEHVAGLGWPASRIIVLDQDTGQSGSSQHGRSDLHRLLEA